MRFVSIATLWLGIIVAIAGISLSIWGAWVPYWQYTTLPGGGSADFDNPWAKMALGAIGLLLGGFLAGLGLGLRRGRTVPAAPTTDPTPAASS